MGTIIVESEREAATSEKVEKPIVIETLLLV